MTSVEKSKASVSPAIGPLQPWRLLKALAYMERHLAEHVPLDTLAASAGYTSMHFAKLFRAATGVSPHEYLMRRRVQVAQILLSDAKLSILDISLLVGFRTQAHFSFVFRRFSGLPPHQWKTEHGAALPASSH